MTGTRFLPREIGPRVRKVLTQLPVVVVTGLRQSGKTTLLTADPAFAGRRYFTLDDYATLAAARQSPEQLIAGTEPITIDEVQRCPELLIAIKRDVDRKRSAGRFLLSGSANLALLGAASESLAGRATYLRLDPFTRREASRSTLSPPFLIEFMARAGAPPGSSAPIEPEAILRGGLPPLLDADADTRATWFLGYEQTYLERDVRDLTQVADLVSFRALLKLAALRTGQILNQSDLARDAKLSASTAARYLGVLEASFVLDRLPPFLRNRASRVIKSPKIHIVDSGLAAYLNDVSNLAVEADAHLRGALVETYVAQNLRGILSAHAPRAELSFWHVQGRHEVDFVVSWQRKHLAIEVKAASRFADHDLAGLRALAAATPGLHAGILAYNGSEAVALGEGLFAIPIARLLS